MAIDPETGEEIEEGGAAAGAGDDAGGADEKDAQLAELKKQLEEKDAELLKEKSKDKNFGKFRQEEGEKRSKLGKEVDELRKQVELGEKDRQDLLKNMLGEAEEDALSQLGGEDKDVRAKIKEGLKESELYQGPIKTKAELYKRAVKIYGLLEGKQKQINPVHSFHPMTQQVRPDPEGQKKGFATSQEGEALIRAKFPKVAAIMDAQKKK
jgi:hypothetical protein